MEMYLLHGQLLSSDNNSNDDNDNITKGKLITVKKNNLQMTNK